MVLEFCRQWIEGPALFLESQEHSLISVKIPFLFFVLYIFLASLQSSLAHSPFFFSILWTLVGKVKFQGQSVNGKVKFQGQSISWSVSLSGAVAVEPCDIFLWLCSGVKHKQVEIRQRATDHQQHLLPSEHYVTSVLILRYL